MSSTVIEDKNASILYQISQIDRYVKFNTQRDIISNKCIESLNVRKLSLLNSIK